MRSDVRGRSWHIAVLPVLVLAIAIGYVAAGVADILDPVQSLALTSLQAALVAGQSLALLFRLSAPVPVFTIVVVLQAGLLFTSRAELGIGSLAVMIAAFHLMRWVQRPWAFRVLTALALTSSIIVFLAAGPGGSLSPWVVFALVVSRLVGEYLVPTAIAEFARNRARLADAVRDREEFIERERAYLVEQDRRAERTALARELHDIAGHHLSGIIVSAQAAGALIDTDPVRSRSMMRELEQEARATMVDLRGTVGLLRPDTDIEDDGGRTTVGIPGLQDLPGLLDDVRRRAQHVSYRTTGEPFGLGPIAEACIYRTVQESLANASRHAPGAECTVTIDFLTDSVVVTVENAPSPGIRGSATEGASGGHRGYGLLGMGERAELIGADLTTELTASGGWCNRLRIPRLVQGVRQ